MRPGNTASATPAAPQQLVPVNTRTDRMMARIALVIVAGGLLYGFYSLGGPVYWRVYATLIHPFEDNSASHLVHSAAGTTTPAVDVNSGTAAVTAGGGGTADLSPSPPPPLSPSSPPKPFDPEAYPLSKERVMPLLQDGMIMITWANHHYLDFARSWVYHIKKAGVNAYMVGAMDDEMLRDLVAHDFHCWRMNTGITKHDLGWGSQNFHLMGRFKIKLIRDVLALDVTVIVSDIDTAWTKNPLPYFARYPEADILTSTDQLGPTVKDDSLELFPNAGSAFNIGIMLFRPNSKKFVEDWVKALDDPKMWDQTAFNDLARKGHGTSSPPKNLWKGYMGELTVGVLPCALFASGHTFFVQHKYAELGLAPYVAHATFQYSGTPGKRHRFREALLWDDPPEYFDHAKGFINIDMDLPQALLDAAAQPVQGAMTGGKLADHFALVHHQLLRLRAALAFATVTGRAIILPPIWCQLDKYWAPLWDGNIPGTQWKKPFICPADHVLDLEGGWFEKHPHPDWGPHIDYREYSFLQNPRLPKSVNDSRVTVYICKPDEADCAKGDAPAEVKDGVVRLAPQLTSGQVAKALEGVTGTKILTMQNALDAFKRFDEDQAQEMWERRLKHYTSVFCCLEKNPGWIWYDFFADREHEDRFRRKFTATWLPKHGDSDNNVDGYTPKRRSLLGLEQGQGGELLPARGGEAAVAVADGSSGGGSSSMLAVRQREEAQLLGMPRRLHGEQQEQLQAVRFLQALEVEAMFSAP